jgi:hypothetical protein
MKYHPHITEKILETIRNGEGRIKACTIAGVKYQTFLNWLADPEKIEFFEDVKNAEEYAVKSTLEICSNSLRKLAEGYDVEEVTRIYKANKDGTEGSLVEMKKVTKHIPPNLGAIIHYQTNRDAELWKNRQNITGSLQLDDMELLKYLKNMSPEEIQRRLDELEKRKQLPA